MNLLCRLWRWFTMQWGRGGSLCGWRPEALIPVSPWASGAGLPRPLLRQTFLAEPRHVAQQHSSELGQFCRWVFERGEDRGPLGDGERKDFGAAAVVGLKLRSEVRVVDEAGEFEHGLVTDRDAGHEHAFDCVAFLTRSNLCRSTGGVPRPGAGECRWHPARPSRCRCCRGCHVKRPYRFGCPHGEGAGISA